jgi:dimethylamine/trimethylamine dehydrogenase
MTDDTRYDILFEPVKIGPVTAPNRFYQTPHCTGMGSGLPRTLAGMRGIKAEGGWGVVCTEYCSIHPSSDDAPYPYATLWDADDIRNQTLMTDAVHAHGALAGVELWHGGSYVGNLGTRLPTLGVRSMPCRSDPVQSQRMDRADIKALRSWHRAAALRARDADFDIVYVYPSHGYLLSEFLSRSHNQRTDEYGGSLENRIRLFREILEETKAVIGDRCAIAVRFAADGHGDEHLSSNEARDLVGMLGHLPDLWDLVVADYDEEMGSSRFMREASFEDRVGWVRAMTGKPVVSVGRFTSPDTMLRQVKRGILDFVGAARPSIADPFLPNKIRDNRVDEIRECIGCNICYAHNTRAAPLRCTQNPTMGEEWRKAWHPERVERDGSGSVLIIGAGPAGLEAAHILGKRGFDVALADAALEAGGRVSRESRLPGLSEWARVRDYRLGRIGAMSNVQLYLDSRMGEPEIAAFGADHVILATGARWRHDAIGRSHAMPISFPEGAKVLTPDDIMRGTQPGGNVLVYDDDHYYMGPVIAEHLARHGASVTYVTSAGVAGDWSFHTQEQPQTQRRLLELGVKIIVSTVLDGFDGETVSLACGFTGRIQRQAASAIVLVTSREPDDALYRQLTQDGEAATPHIHRIGDCRAPSLIASAVYEGHRIGRQLGITSDEALRRDRFVVPG